MIFEINPPLEHKNPLLTDHLIGQPYWTALLDRLIGQPYLDNFIRQPYSTPLLDNLFSGTKMRVTQGIGVTQYIFYWGTK